MFVFSFIFDFAIKMYYGKKTEDKKGEAGVTGKGQDFSYESVARQANEQQESEGMGYARYIEDESDREAWKQGFVDNASGNLEQATTPQMDAKKMTHVNILYCVA